MPFDERVVDRVRRILVPLVLEEGAEITEKKMFGGLCFMVNERICCSVTQRGLLVRVGRVGMDSALQRAHVAPMEMKGRRMTGFVVVAPEGIASARDLRSWLRRGLGAAVTSRDEAVSS